MSDLNDMNMDDLDLDMESAEAASEVVAAPTGKKRGPKAGTKRAPAKGTKTSQGLGDLLGTAPKKAAVKTQRNIKKHDRMPLEVLHQRFHDTVNANSEQALTKKQTTAIFSTVEDFMAKEIFPNYAVKFAGINFVHKPRAGRVNPNPQNRESFSFSPAHIVIYTSQPLTDNTAIHGRVVDGEFEAGSVDENGNFNVDHAGMARIQQQHEQVEAYKAERAKNSPLAMAARKKAEAEAAAQRKDEEVEVEEQEELNLDSLEEAE